MKRRDFLKSTARVVGGVTIAGVQMGGLFPGEALAQAGTPVKGGTLRWGHSETTQNLDIHQTGTASTLRLLQNVHDAIVTIDEKYAVIPNLAESFEQSADGLTYTFRLRKGVKFHNGAEMSAADVQYSFDRCRAKETGAVNFEVFNDVAAIETPDPLSVVVRMKKVNAPFLSRLAENGAGVVIPKDSGAQQGTTPIGTGPFKFVRREFGNEVELARHEGYWGGDVWLDKVISREVTEPTVRLTGLRTRQFDVINDIPLDRVAEVEKDSQFQVRKWFPLSWEFLNFNHKVKPFDDRRVRLAIDYMIDKDVIAQGAIWGQGRPTASPSFPQSPSHNAALKPRPQDFAKAAALLKEAGVAPSSLEFTFKVTNNYPWQVEAVQIMQDWFNTAGLKVKTQQLNWADWLSQCWINRDFSVTMVNFFTLWEPDFLYYSLWNSTGAFNFRNIVDPVIDEMTEKGRRTVDPAARNQIYKEIQARIFEECHDIILYYRNGTLAAQTNVGGLDKVVHPNGSNLQFKNVWLKA